MATKRELRQLIRALRYDSADERELAAGFLRHKLEVYVTTLIDLADQYGYTLNDDVLELDQDVIDALAAEAKTGAAQVVATYNREVEAVIDRNADRPAPELLDVVDAWSKERGEAKSEIIAIDQAYPAHADATVAFFASNDIEPSWHFGGHPEEGDEPPECPVCQALQSGGPFTTEQVLAIGTPHIGCRQSWHPDVADDQLPDSITFGRAVAGIVGNEALVNRHDNDRAAAVQAIHDLTGGSTQP